MYQNARSLQRSFSTLQSKNLNTVATYGFSSPAVFAAQEHLDAHLARRAVVGDGGPRVATRPIRRWFGERLVWLGTRLGGTGVPERTTLTPGKVAA